VFEPVHRFSEIYFPSADHRIPSNQTSSARHGIQALPGIDQHFPNDLHAAHPLNRTPIGDGERVNQFGVNLGFVYGFFSFRRIKCLIL